MVRSNGRQREANRNHLIPFSKSPKSYIEQKYFQPLLEWWKKSQEWAISWMGTQSSSTLAQAPRAFSSAGEIAMTPAIGGGAGREGRTSGWKAQDFESEVPGYG